MHLKSPRCDELIDYKFMKSYEHLIFANNLLIFADLITIYEVEIYHKGIQNIISILTGYCPGLAFITLVFMTSSGMVINVAVAPYNEMRNEVKIKLQIFFHLMLDLFLRQQRKNSCRLTARKLAVKCVNMLSLKTPVCSNICLYWS